jgi:hypothetical protein
MGYGQRQQKSPTMRIQAMREQKALLAERLNRLTEELDEFVRANIENIRSMLVHHESGMPEVSEGEMLSFFTYRLGCFVDAIRGEIRDVVRRREKGWIDRIGSLLMMECLYVSFLGEEGEPRKSGNDYYVDCMLDLKSGRLHIENVGEVLSLYDPGVTVRPYPALDQLFARRFALKLGVASLRWYVFVKKLELGIGILRMCHDAPEDMLMPSYRRYREGGIDVLVAEEDVLNEEFRERGRRAVEDEIGVILHKDCSDRRKILLVNYMLILFMGVRDVDLSAFEEMDDFYLLLWACKR